MSQSSSSAAAPLNSNNEEAADSHIVPMNTSDNGSESDNESDPRSAVAIRTAGGEGDHLGDPEDDDEVLYDLSVSRASSHRKRTKTTGSLSTVSINATPAALVQLPGGNGSLNAGADANEGGEEEEEEPLELNWTNVSLIACFGGTLFAVALSSSLQTPFVSQILYELTTDYLAIGVCQSMLQFGALASSMIFGFFGEPHKYGRTAVLCLGLSVLGACTMLIAAVDDLAGLHAVLFALGLGTAATMGTVYSLVADHFPKNTMKVLSLVETAAGIAWVVGPFIPGFLWTNAGSEAAFFTAGGIQLFFCAVAFALLTRHYRRTSASSSGGSKESARGTPSETLCDEVGTPPAVALKRDESSQSRRSVSQTSSSALDKDTSSVSYNEDTLNAPLAVKLRLFHQPLVYFALLVTVSQAFAYYAVLFPLSVFLSDTVLAEMDDPWLLISILYALVSLFYAIAAYAVPFITRHVSKQKLMTTSIVLSILVFVVMAGYPLDYRLVSRQTYSGLLGLVLCVEGFAYTLGYVLSNLMLIEHVALKYPEYGINGLCTGLFVAGVMLGDAAGLIVGGAITAEFGFEVNSLVSGIMFIGVLVLGGGLLLWDKRQAGQNAHVSVKSIA